MRKSFISLIILISFPLLVAAGFNFGFIKAVKKKVEKLDKKVQTKKAKAISSIPVSEVIVGSWTYGVSSNNDEYSVQQTTDGGYIIATASGSTNVDIWLLKTDSNGNKLWDKTFGGVGNENAYSVQQTSDGGYIIAGSSNSSGGGNHDFWLIKTDSSGNELWNKTFGGANGDIAHSVQQTSDGGYIVAGVTDSYGAGSGDFWLIKTDSSGNQTWAKTFGGVGYEAARSVKQTSDGGYILAGITDSYGTGPNDFWLLKTDSSGNQTWTKTFGGANTERANSVQQTSDGGYIVAGVTTSYGVGVEDFWLLKTDSSGNQTWAKTFGTASSDEAKSVQQTTDDGYIITGLYGGVPCDGWLIKTDSSGNQTWAKTFGGSGDDGVYSVNQTTDGGYVMTGVWDYAGAHQLWLIKTDSNGNIE